MIIGSKYVGLVKSSINEILKRYKGPLYISCIGNNETIRIIVYGNKVTKTIDLNKILQCKVFIIEKK